MAVWKLKRVGPVSSATGTALGPDTEIVTALFGQDEEQGEDRVRGAGFIRKDFLPEEATEEALKGAFCTWQTRTPPEKPEKEKRFDLGMAREFLERMLREPQEDRTAVCLTLALLLARKRRLTIVDQGADFLRVRWPKDKEVFTISAPEVSEADAETLQQDLMRLFDLQVAGAPPAAEESAPDAAEAVQTEAVQAEAVQTEAGGDAAEDAGKAS